MTDQERKTIDETRNVAIIAPAGHGKTEMISELVLDSGKPKLILTHTNAGVASLVQRMKKKKIHSSKYHVSTIAAFCNKWCLSFPQTAHFDTTLNPTSSDQTIVRRYYDQIYPCTKRLFCEDWAGRILKATYDNIIVDEYQDCTVKQHAIILQLANYLPIKVFGDPLQGIFGFNDPLVDWNNLGFPIIPIETLPWRWSNTNPQLGKLLHELRVELEPTLQKKVVVIKLNDAPGCIKLIHPDRFSVFSLLPDLKEFSSTVFITKWENKQLDFARTSRGIFQHDETQDCKDLYSYALKFDTEKGITLDLAALDFLNACTTGFVTESKCFYQHLTNGNIEFSKISRCEGLGDILTRICSNSCLNDISVLIDWILKSKDYKIFRKELLEEMSRCIKYACSHSISLVESLAQIRRCSVTPNRYSNYKYLSSRTLLSKGLEFDCVILDIASAAMSAKDFYVAITRAKHMLYIITSSNTVMFN